MNFDELIDKVKMGAVIFGVLLVAYTILKQIGVI